MDEGAAQRAESDSAVQQWLRQSPMPTTPRSMVTRRVLVAIAIASFVLATAAFVVTMMRPEPDDAKFTSALVLVVSATPSDTGQCSMVVQRDGHMTSHATSDFGCPKVGSYTRVTVPQSSDIRLVGRLVASAVNALMAFIIAAVVLGIAAQLVAWGRRHRPRRELRA